jgi:hypothetical protein
LPVPLETEYIGGIVVALFRLLLLLQKNMREAAATKIAAIVAAVLTAFEGRLRQLLQKKTKCPPPPLQAD